MGTRYDNILGTVGRTPVVRINKMALAGVEVYGLRQGRVFQPDGFGQGQTGAGGH